MNPVQTLEVVYQNPITFADLLKLRDDHDLPVEMVIDVKSGGSFEPGKHIGYSSTPTPRLTIQP